jgi:hypothetical protein
MMGICVRFQVPDYDKLITLKTLAKEESEECHERSRIFIVSHTCATETPEYAKDHFDIVGHS